MFVHADRSLLERAHRCRRCLYWRLHGDNLRHLSAQEGIDFATALLYERLVNSTKHGPFIRQIESLATSDESPLSVDVTVVIVPALSIDSFHNQELMVTSSAVSRLASDVGLR